MVSIGGVVGFRNPPIRTFEYACPPGRGGGAALGRRAVRWSAADVAGPARPDAAAARRVAAARRRDPPRRRVRVGGQGRVVTPGRRRTSSSGCASPPKPTSSPLGSGGAPSPPSSGSTTQDQVRVATALSELCRELAGGGKPATCRARRAGRHTAAAGDHRDVVATRAVADLDGTDGLAAAARLMDSCEVATRAGQGAGRAHRRLRAVSEPFDGGTGRRAAQAVPDGAVRQRAGRAAHPEPGPADRPRGAAGPPGGPGAGQRRARGDQPRRLGACTRSCPTSWNRPTRVWSRSTPSWTRRPGSCGRPARARPGSGRASATSCARPSTPCSACPGSCSTPTSDAVDRRAAAPDRADPRFRLRRLLTLVNDLLDVARAEAGQIEVRFQLVDLVPLLRRLCAALRPMVAAGVELVVDVPRSGAGAAHRSRARRTGAAQPAQQRRQVHRARARALRGQRRRRERRRRDRGERHRDRHPRGAPGAGLRGVLPGARSAAAGTRGHRARAVVRPAGRHRAGRQPHARQRVGSGDDRRAAPAVGARRQRSGALRRRAGGRGRPRVPRDRALGPRAVHATDHRRGAPAPRPCTCWPRAHPTS